jgi:hypothetical protein
MGSGISLSKKQIVYMIKQKIREEFELQESMKNKICYHGYLLYENFDNEENFHNKIKKLNDYLIYFNDSKN